jgi:hypothetical protein
MKSAFALIALFAVSTTAAHADYSPDKEYTVLVCRDANLDLVDAGTAVVIKSGGFAGLTLAEVSENTFHGPMALGTVAVHSVPQTHSVAPVIYEGRDFELAIYTRLAPLSSGMLHAHLNAEIGANHYDQDMACEFYAHTL